MANYQNKKVEIFSGINDIPLAPNSNSGGNISHLYSLYNALIDLLETDVNALQASLAIDYSTDITTLQTNVSNLETSLDINTNNIANNTNNITTNTSSIGTLNTNVSNIQATVNNNTSAINALDTRVTAHDNSIQEIYNILGAASSVHFNNTNFYVDPFIGDDSADGLTPNTPFFSISKLLEVLGEKHLPETITINIRYYPDTSFDFSRLTTQIKGREKDNRPKIIITTDDVSNFQIYTAKELIRTNPDYPLYIEFNNCDFVADKDAIDIINCNSFIKFASSCNFDANPPNTNSIFYIENSEVEFRTFNNDLIFNNTNSSALECAVKLVNSRARFEQCTINNINTFVIAQNNSVVINSLNSNTVTNVTTQYDIRAHSKILTNRYNLFNEPDIIIDGTSTINNFVVFDKNFTNPPLTGKLNILVNAPKDYYIRVTGYSGFYNNLVSEIYADNNSLSSQNNKLNKGQTLSIDFTGTTSIDYVNFQIQLHDFI